MTNSKTILISRTDSIGDVVLTLPLAGIIKKVYPNDKILFLGKNYTRDVVSLSKNIDVFISYDELLNSPQKKQVEIIRDYKIDICIHVFPVWHIARLIKAAGIKTRIGTTNRLYHWFTCNRLVKLSRRKSQLHESQLNTKLLAPVGITTDFNLNQIKSYYGFVNVPVLDNEFKPLLDTDKKKIIIHPRSKGSAKEWGLKNFAKLILLLTENNYQVYISGTKEEGESIRDFIDQHPQAIDLTGQFSLQQFIAFIAECDGLVAASTGPLHIAAALGKKAIGLFSPRRPIHPERWMPIGKSASYLVNDENCEKCAQKKECDCITDIDPNDVLDKLEN